jgi:DNA-binding ferritin-like protein
LYSEFLVEASSLLDHPELVEVARLYRLAADAWDDVADAVLPDGFEPLTRAAELAGLRRKAVQRGDVGDSDAAEAAAGLEGLAREFESGLPLSEDETDALLTEMSEAIRAAHDAEVTAHAALQEAVGRTSG